MSPALEMAGKMPHQFDGEIEIFIEFPKAFDGNLEFLSFTGECGVNGFYRNDPLAIEFLLGAVSGDPVIAPRGLPANLADETKNAFGIHSGEIQGTPSYLRLSDIDHLFAHHKITPQDLNPLLQSSLAVLATLSDRYGGECRIVFWLHDV